MANESPDQQTLANFRRYTASHIEGFVAAKDRIFHLLGRRQQHASGIYREGLFKDFLRSLLPTAVSVDSGFIYGFDQIPASGQLDVIVWHSAKHAPVYRGHDFVIVPPESVVSVLSVKSRLDNRDLKDGLDNLLTVTPIELRFREFQWADHAGAFPPITKFLVAYSTRRPPQNIQKFVADYYIRLFATDGALATALTTALKEINPLAPAPRDQFLISRLLPRMIATIDLKGPSFFVGLGPPDNIINRQTYGPGLRRLPYLYRQSNLRTRSFEKLCFEVLKSVYRIIGTLDWPTTAAWIDVDPVKGFQGGDAWEVEEDSEVSLVDPDTLAINDSSAPTSGVAPANKGAPADVGDAGP